MGTVTSALGSIILSLLRRMLSPRKEPTPLNRRDFSELKDHEYAALRMQHEYMVALRHSYHARMGYYLREMHSLLMRYPGSGMWSTYLARFGGISQETARQYIDLAGDWPHDASKQADSTKTPGSTTRLVKSRLRPENEAMAEQKRGVLALRGEEMTRRQDGQTAGQGSWWDGEEWVSLDDEEPWGEE